MLALLLAAAAVLAAGRALDEALAWRVSAGGAAATRVVSERCASVALAVARRVLRQPAESEEVVQETFLEVWRRAATFDPARGSLTAWVVAITHSRAVDRLRSRASADRAAMAASREDQAPVPQPLESTEQRQERERVRAALGTLPAEQRQVIELAYYEGLTQREIAARTGDPLGTVKTRARLGLEKLAQLLREPDQGGEA
ncbi:MAG: sigma-70 family RNA polymerase sigma factor [Myxococcales bacterium]